MESIVNFSELYDTHVDSLFSFGTRFTSDREMIKDCIQDVFVKLFTKQEYLSSVNNIQSYLFISLRNRINDEFRRNSKIADEEIDDKCLMGITDDNYENDVMEERVCRYNDMQKYVQYLSPRQRQIIHLYYIEQRKYDDICQEMGINYQSVRNLMHRSLTRLRALAANSVAV